MASIGMKRLKALGKLVQAFGLVRSIIFLFKLKIGDGVIIHNRNVYVFSPETYQQLKDEGMIK